MAQEWSAKPHGEEEEEGEEEIDETHYKHAKDAILFAIDVSHSMLTPPTSSDSTRADRDSALSASLKCAYELMTQRIISNPNDMMGILLYGTEQSRYIDVDMAVNTSFPHCYILADLDIPSAEEVLALKKLIMDPTEFDKLMIPSEEPVTMINLLICANQIFATRAASFVSRRLFIVTDNDDPNSGDKASKAGAATRAKDLYDLGVTIELFPVAKPGDEFDRAKFYNDILYSAAPTDPEAPAPISKVSRTSSASGGISLLNSLMNSISSKAVPKRALFSNLPFEIGPGLTISVKGYIIFKRQEPSRTAYVWLKGEGEKPQIAKMIPGRVADDDGRGIEKGEIRRAFKFGGEQVTFTPDELTSIRCFGEPVIRVIGFKPINEDTLPMWANTKTSTFLYPSEEDYVGSTRVFSALQQKLLQDKKMAVAWFIARKNAIPRVAAILPGEERFDDEGDQIAPPGMWLIPLPYADDIRVNPETTIVSAPESLIDKMRTVVRQLQLPKAKYFPSRYPNPALQWHYRILQTLALDEEVPDQAEDKTIPRYKQIHKRVGTYAIEWGDELTASHRLWEAKHGSVARLPKRSAPPKDGEGTAQKRAKVADSETIMGDDEMKDHFKKDCIHKLTVSQLKAWMTSKGLNTRGKKAELVDAIEEFFESH